MTLIQPSAFSGSEPRKRRRIIILMAARGFQLRLSRWFQRSHASVSQSQDEDDRGGERNGLMRSHLDQIVPVTDFAGTSNSKALAVRVEPAKVTLETRSTCVFWCLVVLSPVCLSLFCLDLDEMSRPWR